METSSPRQRPRHSSFEAAAFTCSVALGAVVAHKLGVGEHIGRAVVDEGRIEPSEAFKQVTGVVAGGIGGSAVYGALKAAGQTFKKHTRR